MPKECYTIYLQLIEPGIKSIIKNYLSDWKEIETLSMLMVMRCEGAYKTSVSYYDLEEKDMEKYMEYVNIDVYKATEKKYWKISSRINYLNEKGILQKSSYEFFKVLNEKRNKIHKPDLEFTEEDFEAFSIGHSLLFHLWTIMSSNDENDLPDRLESIEKSAETILAKIQK
ncbi:MAG TPA: hypothetical protein VJ201_05600 [Candidatus Babeliales bacterium]|nr:hypothetical protein [Candidatus Babeliales bacterium]